MSEPPGAATDDLVDAPFIDDDERAESAWLVARDGDPGAAPPSLEVAAHYAVLEDLLRELPAGRGDEAWQASVLRAVAATHQRGRRRRIAAVVAAIAAIIAVVVVGRPSFRAPELAIEIHHLGAVRGGWGEVANGDHLIARAHGGPGGPRRATSELRVYRAGGALVGRCPGGPGCTVTPGGELVLEVALDAPVAYRVLFVTGLVQPLAGETLEAYLAAARAANARIVTPEPIEVH